MKLSDFGPYGSHLSSRTDSEWDAPEVLLKLVPSGENITMVDIFALGCIFCLVIEGNHPFGNEVSECIENIKSARSNVRLQQENVSYQEMSLTPTSTG